ncbi:hypothetical protein P0G10_14490 [Eubacteriales bacterium DFI.9.88]|nr:hypothetical protein [Hominibacterium faecale]MDE8734305.1 hypothetical protein [Eubacteriales bacterium DFI.9.88]
MSANKEIIDEYQPFAVIVATGAEAAAPEIPGSDSDWVVTCHHRNG